MKTLPIDYKEYTVNTSVLLIDPPWKYDDRPKSTQIHQVTYGVWENEAGLDILSASGIYIPMGN